MIFQNRTEAGRKLAQELFAYKDKRNIIVLALPRGGVPVAFEIVSVLHLPLDLMIVRKLGVPWYEEFAMGAIATGDIQVLNEEVVGSLSIPDEMVAEVVAKERTELERRNKEYRQGKPPPNLEGKTVILVDDGCATGANMEAAVQAARKQNARRVIAAVPVASESAYELLRDIADDVVCLSIPQQFYGVGGSYYDFSQTSDSEVKSLLKKARYYGAASRKDKELQMAAGAHTHLVEEIRKSAIPLSGHASDYDELIDIIGDARYVLIGEATHGSEEFYRIRADITKRLIHNHGFSAVAVEGDFPDCYQANRYVRGDGSIPDADNALGNFARFPTWMWRNETVLEFLDWLKDYNSRFREDQEKAGFYGLDLYSLYTSIQAVIEYLEKIDPKAAERARDYYACFDHRHRLAEDPQEYGYAAGFGITAACEKQAIEQLVEIRQNAFKYMQRDGFNAGEELFCAEQNAKIVIDAEKYYRTMFEWRVSSWNLRDKHMAETLYALTGHLSKWRGKRAKIVVWAHNSHIGDARATEMGQQGEWNIGQLVRESHGEDVALIGFSTYRGTVTAASHWGGEAERKAVLPAMSESYEALFHEVGIKDFILMLKENDQLRKHLDISRLQRAIGVLYLPQTERMSHYFFSKLPEQFDAIIHVDTTHALKPLEKTEAWHEGEIYETYPSGI